MSKGDPSKDKELALAVRNAAKALNTAIKVAQRNGLYVDLAEERNMVAVQRITRGV